MPHQQPSASQRAQQPVAAAVKPEVAHSCERYPSTNRCGGGDGGAGKSSCQPDRSSSGNSQQQPSGTNVTQPTTRQLHRRNMGLADSAHSADDNDNFLSPPAPAVQPSSYCSSFCSIGGGRRWSLSTVLLVTVSLLAALLPTAVHSSSELFDDSHLDDSHVRLKRSNIPCGSAFTPCSRRPAGFEVTPFDALGLEASPEATSAEPPNIRQNLLLSTVREAKRDIDDLFNRTERTIRQRRLVEHSGPSVLWSSHRKSYAFVKDISYPALVSISASQRLKSLGLRTNEIVFGLPKTDLRRTVLEDVCPPNPIAECVPGTYRTYAGHCNNVNKPLWGAAYEPMQRYLAPDYGDDVNTIRRAASGASLPNARIVSTELVTPLDKRHRVLSMMTALWSQFVYNDLVHLAEVKGENMERIPCCSSNVEHPECATINVTPNDKTLKGIIGCLPYIRTTPAPREGCTLGPRQQANLASSYLDASSVYGSTARRTDELRTFSDGQMRSSRVPFLKDLLPQSAFDDAECLTPNKQACFLAGSDHANFQPTLTSLHTLWMREHNRIATKLKELNNHWGDERLFQEARRVVSAQIQHITFNEYLPSIVGVQNLQNFGLELHNNGFYADYSLDVEASVLNVYAASVGQFFFALMPDTVGFYPKSYDPLAGNTRNAQQVNYAELLYNPSSLYFQDRLDSLVRYLMHEPMGQFGLHMAPSLTSQLFKGSREVGYDMAALIIQMGRDHGIPSYTVWRAQCGLRRPSNFEDLEDIVSDSSLIEKLQQIYQSVDDIDLFVLGLAERPLKGALVGPTFACLLSKQFQKVRRGDRFWYENFFVPSSMNEEQINEVRKSTLARVICDNTDDIGLVQPAVMQLENNFENCMIECNNTVIGEIDLSLWKDREPERTLPISRDILIKASKIGSEKVELNLAQELQQITLRDSTGIEPNDAALSHANGLSAKQTALDISKRAAVLLEMTKTLVRGSGLNSNERLPANLDQRTLFQLLPHVDIEEIIESHIPGDESSDTCLPKTLPCDHTSKYRTYTGWCNNLQFPSYGEAFVGFRRLLDPAYDDGFDEPRMKDKRGRQLPSPRAVSNAVHSAVSHPHVRYTHMLMQFGQFLDHDMTLAPMTRAANNRPLICEDCDSNQSVSPNCLPIEIPRGDPFFPERNPDGTKKCLPFARSLVGQLKLGYRNQINQLTAYIDASQIYSNNECEANHLRLFSMGKLNYTERSGGLRHGLPQGSQERDCRTAQRERMCFVAGDERNNEHPALTTMHTIWMREHNRIATVLHRINNFWADERIYQETRRIVGAMLQHITYNEFLPKVLGCEFAARYDLVPKRTGYYKDYNRECDASMSNEFSTAAMRFGHTLIRDDFPLMDDFYTNFSQPIMLKDHFNDPSPLYDANRGGLDTLLIGLLGAPQEGFDRHVADAVRLHLFSRRGREFSGMDLAAINVMRGRDHGLQPYNKYREHCGQKLARTFRDLRSTHDQKAVDALSSVYSDVDDIDLFPGLMTESPMRGALVGPTTACLLAEQFQRLKKCDRFYYENDMEAVKFTPDQLAEIRGVTLAKVLCGNSQFIRMIQPRVFDMPDDLLNAQVACQDLPSIDLYEWLDRQFCVVDHRVINLGKSKRITPCVACTCTSEGPECHPIRVASCTKLLDRFLFAEIMQDTACVIQCSGMIKRRSARL